MSIRQLRPGERLPDGVPNRYKASHGYIRLRWYLGNNQSVETYEHRVDGDHVTTAEQVHHKNHRRDDNASDNLEPLTSKEHWERHGSPVADRCIDLYRQGIGTVAISREVGIDCSNVYRILQRRGLIDPRRSRSDFYSNPLPSDDQLREWHASGVRVAKMVQMAQVGRRRLEKRLDVLGLPRFPYGPTPRHPKAADIHAIRSRPVRTGGSPSGRTWPHE